MGEWTRDTPWRQGFILKAESAEALGLARPEERNDIIVLVISHDCDLAALPNEDPECEVMVGQRVDAPENDCTDGKNVRLIHLTFTGGETHVTAGFRADSKRTIDKRVFVDHEPAEKVRLNPEELKTLQLWLSARYHRVVFPDNFDGRMKANKIKRKIDKILKRHGAHIIGLYFNLDGGENIERTESDDTYSLAAYILYRSANNPDAQRDAEAAAVAIDRAFRDRFYANDKWKEIEVTEVEVMSDEAMTVAQSRAFKQWYSDYLSLGDPPEEAEVQAEPEDVAAAPDFFVRTGEIVRNEE